jgi:hypothetical protein
MNSPDPKFVLNIIELQNVVTSSSGIDPVTYLSNQVANLQQIVNYDLRQINVNAISNYDTSPIQIYSPLNLCNVELTANGTTVGGGTSSTNSIGSDASGVLYVGGATSLLLTQSGVSSFFIGADCNASFIGSVSATNFITTSDARKKSSITKITDFDTILSSVNGVRFQWNNTKENDIGVIAQDVLSVMPEAVYDTPDGYKVAYSKFVPVLIESVKSLKETVDDLSSRLKHLEELFVLNINQ